MKSRILKAIAGYLPMASQRIRQTARAPLALFALSVFIAATPARAAFLIMGDGAPAPGKAAAVRGDDGVSQEKIGAQAVEGDVSGSGEGVEPAFSRRTIRVSGLRPMSARKDAVIDKGTRPSRLGGRIGVEGALPLAEYMAQVVPPAYSVFSAAGVEPETKVYARPAKNWVESLNQTLAATGYVAAIDWGSKEVVIALDETAKMRREVIKEAKSDRVWKVLKNDGLLSESINRWCRDAGEAGGCLKVSWESSHDMPLEADAQFVGDFNEAITRVMAAAKETSGHVFRHVLHQNMVLVITDGDSK